MSHVRILSRLGGYRPRYADVAATLALVFAMGGSAYAVATVADPNSVNTAAIQDNAVTKAKLHGHAVSTGKLDAQAVTGAKLADGAVGTTNLADLSVTSTKLGDFSVINTKLGSGAVSNSKIAAGAVTNTKIAAGAVNGTSVAANSLSLGDLVGADITGAIGFTINSGQCGTLGFGVSGAQVGQVVLFSFIGNTAVPSSVTFGGAKVTSAGHVDVKACNVGGSDVTVSNLGIRVATFG